jgi:hypothetical protein
MLPIGNAIKTLNRGATREETMNQLASSRCQEGPNRLTFPDILSDPLVRAIMAADHVDPHALKIELELIASTLPARASDGVLAGCCMAC